MLRIILVSCFILFSLSTAQFTSSRCLRRNPKGRRQAMAICAANLEANPLSRCRLVRCNRRLKVAGSGWACQCTIVPQSPKAACNENTKCTTGYACGCAGICTREVTLEISTVSDDSLRIYTCNGQLVTTTNLFNVRSDATFTGGCDDLMVRTVNRVFAGNNYVAAAVKVVVDGNSYGTLSDVAGVTPLVGTGMMSPADGWELNMLSFDYSEWTPLIAVTPLQNGGFAANFMNLASEGGLPVSTISDPNSPPGVYGFRIVVPYC